MKTLNASRRVDIPLYNDDYQYYVRTRDVALVLGIKQPFEFTSHIKKTMGAQSILKGKHTCLFRHGEDGGRTTFVSCTTLYEYLSNESSPHKMLPGQKETVMKSLLNYIH